MLRRTLAILSASGVLCFAVPVSAGGVGERDNSMKMTPPEDRGYLAYPLRIMDRSTYDAYRFDAAKDEDGTATISYSVSKTGWVRVRLLRRKNKDVVMGTLQQWRHSHYADKKKYEIQWDGRDASGNLVDPRQMFIEFEGRDAAGKGRHRSHAIETCKDPELTASVAEESDTATGGPTVLVEFDGFADANEHATEYESRVYLDDELIGELRLPVSQKKFRYRIDPELLTGDGHTVTVNVDDTHDHVGAASVRLQGPGPTVRESTPRPREGAFLQEAPAFSLQDLGGLTQSLADHRGRVVLLNFWATSCAPCIHEMPSLETLYNALGPDSFVVLAVAGDTGGKRTVGPLVERLQLSMPVLLDPESRVAGLYGVRLRPVSYLIDQRGFLVSRIVGARDWASHDDMAAIRGLITANTGEMP